MASMSPAFAAASTRPWNRLPMIELVDEGVADLELAPRRELRHPARGAGAAGRAVDRLLAVEHRIACIRLRVVRRAGPEHVAEPVDGRVLGVDELVFLVDQAAHHRREALDVEGSQAVETGIGRLRFDEGVEIAAIGDVEDEAAELRHVDLEALPVEEGGHVAEPDVDDVAEIVAAVLRLDDAPQAPRRRASPPPSASPAPPRSAPSPCRSSHGRTSAGSRWSR